MLGLHILAWAIIGVLGSFFLTIVLYPLGLENGEFSWSEFWSSLGALVFLLGSIFAILWAVLYLIN